MSQSIKAAWIAFAIISSLTAVKFALYFVSGSIAVLSEAWHSIADIGTTLLVLVSIIKQHRKTRPDAAPAAGAPPDGGAGPAWFIRGYRRFRAINTELKIAVFIGLLLNVAAVAIFWRALAAAPVTVAAPLATGLIFIGLSFGSYFLCRFEEQIGSLEQSAALTADSHHNRADMAISLLTGVSLVLYHFGVDLDRWVGILIALYILTFAAELLYNSVQSIVRGHDQIVFASRFSSIVAQHFEVETYRKLFRFIDERIGCGERAGRIFRFLPYLFRRCFTWGLRTAVAAVVLGFLSTMLYTVERNEQALLLRFGKVVNHSSPIGPGLHLKFPYPVDTVKRFDATTVTSLVVGNALAEETAMIWTREHGDDRFFISGDDNIFLPYIVIHYRISDIHRYHLGYTDGAPTNVLASLSLQLLNHLFSTTSFYDLLLSRRGVWTEQFRELLQEQCDRLELGIDIVEFCLRDLHPPIELAGAYEEVVAANQLKEAQLNDAERKVNALLSRARISRLRTIAEAESYVIEKEKIAAGEAANYLLRYSGFTEGGEVMKDILLLKAAAKTLAGKKIFLVDPNSGIDENLLYIENYLTGRKNR